MKRSALLFHHFFHPDDVVSARHFGDLATGLHQRGWDVTVLTSNRYCRREPGARITPPTEMWEGVRIVRSARPGLNQSKSLSRLLNGFFLGCNWLYRVWRLPRPDVIVLGTDPQFSQCLLPFMRLLARRSKLVLWAFDLYPDAILAEQAGTFLGRLAGMTRGPTRLCFRCLDMAVDLGPCMRERVKAYNARVPCHTLVPWALVEPERPQHPVPSVREALFGDAALGLLYSGTMGHAHDYRIILKLARSLRSGASSVAFCFSCRGNAYDQLRAEVTEADTNIRFVEFCSEAELAQRLGAADIHLISLKHGWEGVVVPSKFFGVLAVGKPILYAGSRGSDIGQWIKQHAIGWTLDNDNGADVARALVALAGDPSELEGLGRRCFEVYHSCFSKRVVLDGWDVRLRELLEMEDG